VPPSDEQLTAEVDTLVAQLDAPQYDKREAATERLTRIGPVAFAQLRDAYHQTDALEARLRIERIVRENFFGYQVYDRNGFLGIGQHPIPKVHDDDERIEVGKVGIEVQRVIEDTAAEVAGLKARDVIIALDGEPITAAGSRVITQFGESIRVRGPGVAVVLTVLRGPLQLEVEALLGARPQKFYTVNQGPVHEMIQTTRQQFEVFWNQHFHHPPGKDNDGAQDE
jgi:hypothetical protein